MFILQSEVDIYEIEKEKHIVAWADILDKSYVEIDGDDAAEFALNYSIYHLNCIAPRNMKNKSILQRDGKVAVLDVILYNAKE